MSSFTFTTSDGVNLFVKGLGDLSSSKPLLIALHGAPGYSDHNEPEMTLGFLQDLFRVIVYDARGSGVSDLKGPYTNERWAADVEELRVWAGAEKIVLAGGSYGGVVALTYATTFKDRLLGLILRDTMVWGMHTMLNIMKSILTSKRINPDPERQLRLWSGLLRDDQDFEDAVDEMAALFAADDVPAIDSTSGEAEESTATKQSHHSATQNAAFGENMPKYDLRAKLKDIAVPTLVIHGRKDGLLPVSYAEDIHNGIPNSQLVIFEKSGHNPGFDEAELFKKITWDFVKSSVLQ